jgi:putative oxidoreductase
MFKSLGNYSDLVPLILRLGLGTTHVFSHGIPKLLEGPERWEGTGRAMGNLGITFAPMFWGFMAGATEAVGGLLLILGLFVRPTSVVLLFVLFVAAVQNLANAGNLTGGRAHPVDAGFGLLAILILGAGKYSLERKWGLDKPVQTTVRQESKIA